MCCCGCCCCCKFDENDPDSYCAQKRAAKQQRKLNKRIGPHLRAVENNNAVKPHYQYQAPLDLPALARLDSERRGSSLSLSRSREGSLKGAKEGKESKSGDGKSAIGEGEASASAPKVEGSSGKQDAVHSFSQPQSQPRNEAETYRQAGTTASGMNNINRSNAASPEPRARASIDTLSSAGSTRKAPIENTSVNANANEVENEELHQQATGGQGSSTGTSDRVRELLERVHEPEEAPPSYQAAMRH